jgi:hypothetical protein
MLALVTLTFHPQAYIDLPRMLKAYIDMYFVLKDDKQLQSKEII